MTDEKTITDSDGIGAGGVGGHAKYLVLLQIIDTAAKSCYEARKSVKNNSDSVLKGLDWLTNSS